MSATIFPADCPPNPHDTHALGPVYRVLAGANPAPVDWQSHDQKGQPLPHGMCKCRWVSISLFTNTSVVKKFKNLAHLTHAAELHIPANAGAHITKRAHIDFWSANNAALAQHVTAVVPI